jgi:hypothetical protein
VKGVTHKHHTRVTIQWSVAGHASPEEMATFVAERDGMTLGWTGSFDKLDERLTALRGNHAP